VTKTQFSNLHTPEIIQLMLSSHNLCSRAVFTSLTWIVSWLMAFDSDYVYRTKWFVWYFEKLHCKIHHIDVFCDAAWFYLHRWL